MDRDTKIEYYKGLNNLDFCIKNKKDVQNAFFSELVGSISLIYGTDGDKTKNFKGGYGIAHIIAKRNFEALTNSKLKNQNGTVLAGKLIEVICFGTIYKTIVSKQTIHIRKDNYEAVLSLDLHGNKVCWLLTGYKII